MNLPTVWTEIVKFDKIMRTTEGCCWFKLRRNAKELMFNVFKVITLTITGFVAVACRQGYGNALSTGAILPEIFKHPQMRGTQQRQNLQSTILTMTAGPCKEASFDFKNFLPPEAAAKKRPAPNDALRRFVPPILHLPLEPGNHVSKQRSPHRCQ